MRQTFLTPFDRGSITSLIGAMDDAIDEMQDTARAIALYELESFEPEMKRMVKIIVEQAGLTAQAIPMLRDISRNGPKIHSLTEKLVHLESDADVVHAAGLKKAFQAHSDEADAVHGRARNLQASGDESPTRSRTSRMRSTAS